MSHRPEIRSPGTVKRPRPDSSGSTCDPQHPQQGQGKTHRDLRRRRGLRRRRKRLRIYQGTAGQDIPCSGFSAAVDRQKRDFGTVIQKNIQFFVDKHQILSIIVCNMKNANLNNLYYAYSYRYGYGYSGY